MAPGVIAKVNDENLSREQFIKNLGEIKKKFRVDNQEELKPTELIWLKTQTLNLMIRDTLFFQEAKNLGLQVNNEEFEEELLLVKNDYSKESFARLLDVKNIPASDLNSNFKKNILFRKLIEKAVNESIIVTENELLDYYVAHQKDFEKKRQVRALHIMVETEDEALDLHKKLKKKGNKFDDFARRFSLGPESSQGGDMGYFERGQMPEAFDVVFDLKKGRRSQVIKSNYGYHIFKVMDIIDPKKLSFEEARPAIKKIVLEQRQEKAFKSWVSNLKRKADIKINHEALEAIS